MAGPRLRQIFCVRSKNARSFVGRQYVTRDGPSAGRGRAGRGRFLVWRLSLLRVTVRRSMEPGCPSEFRATARMVRLVWSHGTKAYLSNDVADFLLTPMEIISISRRAG